MVSKVKFPKSVTLTYNACVAGIRDGLTQTEILKQIGISKPTLKDHLTQKDTSWRLLSKEVNSNVESKRSKSTKVKSSKVKNDVLNNTSKLPSPTQIDSKEDEDNDDPETEGAIDGDQEVEISQQYKDIVQHVRYAQKYLEKVTFSDGLKFYKETKMLENQDKDFEEEDQLLSKFEAMVREFEPVAESIPDLTKVEIEVDA